MVKLNGISVTALDPDRYESWSVVTYSSFVLLKLSKFLDGTATVTDYNSATEYDQAREEALHMLVLYVGEKLSSVVRPTDSACDIWVRLRENYMPQGFGTQIATLRAFLNMEFDVNKHTGQTWCSAVETSALRLKTLGVTMPDFLVVYVLLYGLGPSWNTFVQTLDQVEKNAAKPDYVKRRIINEWTHRQTLLHVDDVPDQHDEARAMGAHFKSRIPSTSKPLTTRRAPARPSGGPPRFAGQRGDEKCYRCQLLGHIAADCNIRLEGDRYMTEAEIQQVSGTGAANFAVADDGGAGDEDQNVDDQVLSF